jgi:hypothetical protein
VFESQRGHTAENQSEDKYRKPEANGSKQVALCFSLPGRVRGSVRSIRSMGCWSHCH